MVGLWKHYFVIYVLSHFPGEFLPTCKGWTYKTLEDGLARGTRSCRRSKKISVFFEGKTWQTKKFFFISNRNAQDTSFFFVSERAPAPLGCPGVSGRNARPRPSFLRAHPPFSARTVYKLSLKCLSMSYCSARVLDECVPGRRISSCSPHTLSFGCTSTHALFCVDSEHTSVKLTFFWISQFDLSLTKWVI